MTRFPIVRTAPLFAALLIAAALAAPAMAMEVTINEVQSSVRTNDSGGGSYLGGLVQIVVKALEEDAQRKRRQQSEQGPQQPA